MTRSAPQQSCLYRRQLTPATPQPNVAGIILAGSADFKTELSQSDLFDIRLQAVIVNIVDVSYGGENGFNQAIELSGDILANVKFIKEKKLIAKRVTPLPRAPA